MNVTVRVEVANGIEDLIVELRGHGQDAIAELAGEATTKALAAIAAGQPESTATGRSWTA
jgi:hypothetical protein